MSQNPESSKLTTPFVPPLSPLPEFELPQTSKAAPKYKPASPSFVLSVMELDLNILLKFIKPYDGGRDGLNSFLTNCNNAFDLATQTQKYVLFKYILSQLQGKAEIACSIKEFSTWEQLKEFLKNQFSERKHVSHLLTDLQESKQGQNETVTQFSLRIETCLSQLLTEISLTTIVKSEIPGRTSAMEDLALHHFLMGLHPRISNIVRCRCPKNLNEAINIAISEERIQLALYKKPALPNPTAGPSRFQPRPSHFQTRQQFGQFPSQQQPGNPRFRPQQRSNAPNGDVQFRPHVNASNTVCRYCKFPGHTVENCRKREYNNRRFGNSQDQNRPIHHVRFDETEEEGIDEIDTLNE